MTDDALDQMAALAGALPFLKRYDDQTVVVKYGGHAMGQEETALRFGRDIALLEQVGVNPVVVHGGGPQINAMLKRLNVKSTFVQGLRVTDEEMLDVVEMVLAGPVNKQVAEAITRAGAIAVGISGKDGGLIRARKLAHLPRSAQQHRAGAGPRLRRRTRGGGCAGAQADDRGGHRAGRGAGRCRRRRPDLQHQRRHRRRCHRRRAGCGAPADADRRAGRARHRWPADPRAALAEVGPASKAGSRAA